jgi:hypothetical protein
MVNVENILDKILGKKKDNDEFEKRLGLHPKDGKGFHHGPRKGMKLGPQDGTGPNKDCEKK